MKLIVVLSVLIFYISFSEQKAKYVKCPENHESDPKAINGCYEIQCSSNKYGSLRFKHDCPEVECSPGTQKGYKEPDITKEFPDCCGEPICKANIIASVCDSSFSRSSD